MVAKNTRDATVLPYKPAATRAEAKAADSVQAAGQAAGSDKRTRLEAVRDARRGSNRIRRLHHHAVRTDDMEATRRFYEDVVGMPMVAAFREKRDRGNGMPFLHCFFEMADGGSLAFFQFLPDAHGPANKLPPDAIDHHIAMSVAGSEDVARLKAKFDELGYSNCGINHGFCFSLYVRDPNGMLVEFVADSANELEMNEAAAASAHAELAKWLSHDYTPNPQPPVMEFPLPTSPIEDIMRVMSGHSKRWSKPAYSEPPAK